MITCPLCNMKKKELPDLLLHIEEEHKDAIPKDFSVARFYYMMKTGKEKGSCIVCKKETNFNEATGKYHRLCKNPECKKSLRAAFKANMKKVGKEDIMNDPDHQRKMLANRSISGKYKWSDGVEIGYTGSYEKDFLQFLDLFMGFESNDIMAPSPNTYYYEYEGKKRHYIPDMFIVSLNMEIEIKDGGKNPNMHGKIQAVDKVKEKLKDEAIITAKHVSYVKVLDKSYGNFASALLDMKRHLKDNGEYARVVDLGTEEVRSIETLMHMKPVVAKESIQEAVLASPKPETLTFLEDNFEVEEYVVEEMDDLISANARNHIEILEDLDMLDPDHEVEWVAIRNVLMDGGLIPFNSKTPGFVSPYVGNVFLEVIADIIRRKPELEMIQESIDKKFGALVRNAEDTHALSAYQHDAIVMEYYMKLLDTHNNIPVMSQASSYFRDIVSEAADNMSGGKLYPVFVMLTHTGTTLSNIVKTVTGKQFSHASISFDSSMNEMYSFGRKHKDNPFIGTFVRENIKGGLFEDVKEDGTYALYVTFVTEDELKLMKERLKYFERQDVNFKYSLSGLVKFQAGKESDSVDKFFCSQFVDYILSSNRAYFDKHSSKVEPYDYAKLKDFKLVDTGIVKDYDQSRADKKVEKLSRTFKASKPGKSKLMYIGITKAEATRKEKESMEGEITVATRSFRQLKDSVDTELYTYYTVIHEEQIKSYVISSDSERAYIKLPRKMKLTNVNHVGI